MAGLRVFVSSTCFDLGAHRGQIRAMLERLGYEPVMSDYSDILYDPRNHTHTNCVKDVPSADIIILLVGTRYGGAVVPEALSAVDLEKVVNSTVSTSAEMSLDKLSITQVEVLKAIESNIPVFAFVDSRVHADHHVYQSNKSKPFAAEISYPSIDKPETAKYIFEFINFLSHRLTNNALISYGNFGDIETHLLKQWSMLFQKLLQEQREKEVEVRRAEVVIDQIQDLKAVILQSISGANAKEVARGVIRFRRLLDLLRAFRAVPSAPDPMKFKGSFQEYLRELGVVDVLNVERAGLYESLLVLPDESFFGCRIPFRIERYSEDWEAWKDVDDESKSAIFDAVAEAGPALSIARYRSESFRRYLEEHSSFSPSANALSHVLPRGGMNAFAAAAASIPPPPPPMPAAEVPKSKPRKVPAKRKVTKGKAPG